MRTDHFIEIEATDVRYFSEHDEKFFFEWLERISCVKKYIGKFRTIYITIDIDRVDEQALRELLALYHRYRINMKSLMALEKPEFALWLRNEKAFWYEGVFGN